MTMNLKQIDLAIASIAKRGKTLRLDSHKVLVAIIDHYIEHGDYTRLSNLQTVVDKTFGRSCLIALNQWVQDFVTSLQWDNESAAFIHVKGMDKAIRDVKILANEKKDIPAFEGNARDYPFFNCEKKSDPKPFVLADSFATLLKRAESEYEKSIKEGSTNLKLKAQIEVLKSLHINEVEPEVEIETVRTPAREVAPVNA